MWLPGSQTELAIVTVADVKIFDLAKDVIAPAYHFLLPSGNVRDATFVNQVRKHFFGGLKSRFLVKKI